jgi:hypothetical protein
MSAAPFLSEMLEDLGKTVIWTQGQEAHSEHVDAFLNGGSHDLLGSAMEAGVDESPFRRRAASGQRPLRLDRDHRGPLLRAERGLKQSLDPSRWLFLSREAIVYGIQNSASTRTLING